MECGAVDFSCGSVIAFAAIYGHHDKKIAPGGWVAQGGPVSEGRPGRTRRSDSRCADTSIAPPARGQGQVGVTHLC